MKSFILSLLIPIAAICAAYGNSLNNTSPSPQGDLNQARQFLQRQQMAFEENKGQVTGDDAEKVKFTYRDRGLSIFLMNNGIAYQFSKTHYPEGYAQLDKLAKPEERVKMEALRKNIRTETYRMDISLVGANPHPQISTEGKSEDYTQYYNHDALDVHHYSKVTYHNVYPHIDWVIYSKNGGVKYDFVVHPGGNPAQIKLQTHWVEDLKLNPDGSLSLHNRMGSITEQQPISFQDNKAINTQFNLVNNQITFTVGPYDPGQTLIIDPTLQWATYYGGTNRDRSWACSVDGSGNVYLAGETQSNSFIATGGHQNTSGGFDDAFLVKFNSSGARQWATYYGGSSGDYGIACAVDASGNVYLAGETQSNASIAFEGHQNTFGEGTWDGFLVKFNSSGIRQWATYYGGDDWDFGRSCAVDGAGNVYLAGWTESTSSIASGGHNNVYEGGRDAFLVKFNSNGVRQWATYYGGNDLDYGNSCAVDASGNVYLAGETLSASSIASGGHQNSYGGDTDAFLVKFNSSGVRQWSSYYGGPNIDQGIGCFTDASENIFLGGQTRSTSAIASGGHQNTLGGLGNGYDTFLAKFNSNGIRQWGTYYGGNDEDTGGYGTVDNIGNIYLAGITTSSSAIASGGHQNTYGGSVDAFLVKFNNNGIRQWGSYLGGSNVDVGRFCAADAIGNVYLAGQTASGSSIASGGHQNVYGGGVEDAFLAKFGEIVPCTPTISITANQSASICQGTSISFTATITNGGTSPTYQWQRNGSNVGTNSSTYTSSDNANGDVITCILTSNATCVSPAQVTSAGIPLTVNPLPVVEININGAELEATAGYSTYAWTLNGIALSGATENVITPAANGLYAVQVTDANGCSNAASFDFTVTSADAPNAAHEIQLFPNPTQGDFTLQFSDQASRGIHMYDSFGRLVFHTTTNHSTVPISLTQLANGIYGVKVSDGNKQVMKLLVVLH